MSKNKLVRKKRRDIALVWELLAPGYKLLLSPFAIVSFAAVIRVVMQRSSPLVAAKETTFANGAVVLACYDFLVRNAA